MSRQIDLSKPLSERDREHLVQLGKENLIQTAEGGGEDSSSTAGPVQLKGEYVELVEVVNTGDVNTLQRQETGGMSDTSGGSDLEPPKLDTAEDGDYSEMTVKMLQDELERRDLPKTGKKDELIARLEEDDSSEDEPS